MIENGRHAHQTAPPPPQGDREGRPYDTRLRHVRV
jgi:hypothetical protein